MRRSASAGSTASNFVPEFIEDFDKNDLAVTGRLLIRLLNCGVLELA